MLGKTVKASSIPHVLSPWRYEASFNRWIGGQARAFRAFTAELIDVSPGESVLDLGCGTGELTMTLARRVAPHGRVAGIDLANDLIAGARRKARRADLAIDYRVGSVEQLPFADATMDVVVSSLVLHHLAPEVLARAVGEIRRVLKPGGRIFVIDFQSLDQAGQGHQPAHHPHENSHNPHSPQRPETPHDHARKPQNGNCALQGHHAQERAHPMPHEPLHDHRPILVSLLKEAGMTDACTIPVEFGQSLEVTRGRLTT